MWKALLGGVMLAGLFLGRVPAPDVGAQGRKPSSGPGVIEIGEGKDGKFRFFVRDGDGKLLAMSGPGGFKNAKDAQAAIERLRAVVAKAKVTVAKKKGKGEK